MKYLACLPATGIASSGDVMAKNVDVPLILRWAGMVELGDKGVFQPIGHL